MRAEKNLKIRISTVIFAVLIIAIVALLYISELNKTISNNIIGSISELAIHDQSSIQSYIESNWESLEYIEQKLVTYNCTTIEEIETLMNIECSCSAFSHIYMVSEDGKVYTDKFLTYNPDNEGQNGRIDLLPYFANGREKVVKRFDDKVTEAGLTKESILYGIRLDGFSVAGKNMVALVGISDISNIRDRFTIESFTKDGESRGHSAVINKNGNYIVNEERTAHLDVIDNFFDRIDESNKSQVTKEDIVSRMTEGKTFSFYYNDSNSMQRLVYCMPFSDENIEWYFISSVESVVFAEQNRTFLTMSMVMLVSIVFIIVIILLVTVISQNKVNEANAQAKARSDFLANMSHEIRTPLNGIIGLIYIMEKDIEDSGKIDLIKLRLSKARDTANYLLSLVNNILDISKLQAGKVELGKEIISPEIITDAVWSMMKSGIEDKGIEFVLEKDVPVQWVIGDDIHIKRVLMNIVSNAAKFTSKGGRIVLSVRQEREDEEHVATIYSCEDTGCGMSEEFLEHIWDSFAQERSKNQDSVKGTGLGMTISKLLVDVMGGEIKVKSKQGEGSTFTIIFHQKISNEMPEYLRITNAGAVNVKSDKPVKVLVVEDNELNAEILIEILKGESFEVDYAENGKVAVEKFTASEVGELDAILMDIQMPVMDGYEATRTIRSLDREDAKTIPIFACTANSFQEDREKAVASGMNQFLTKPIDVNVLLQKLGGGSIVLEQQTDD
jgi:signal transduction histidine kinase/CheY-like chemotaxis protein